MISKLSPQSTGIAYKSGRHIWSHNYIFNKYQELFPWTPNYTKRNKINYSIIVKQVKQNKVQTQKEAHNKFWKFQKIYKICF